MNIKKKISFFALFLISSFFIVGEVKGDTYYRYGSANDASVFSSSSTTQSRWTSSYFAYRFTFVKSDGSIVSGTKPADIYFTGSVSSDNLGNKYKFSDTSYSIPSVNINISSSCSTDKCYMNDIIKYYKNNTNGFKKQLLSLTGNKTFDDGEFLVVEKLYTIDIRTTDSGISVPLFEVCRGDYGELNLSADACSDVGPSSPSIIKLINVYSNVYNGTGLEVLKKLNDTYPGSIINGKTVPGPSNSLEGIYFIKNNRSVTNFTGLNIYVGDEVDGFKKLTYVTHYKDSEGRDTVSGDISDTLDKNTSYGINIFAYKDLEKPGCTYDNHTVYDGGRDWNATEGKCCAAGTKYNSKTGNCETECTKNNHISLGRSYNTTLKKCCLPGQNLKNGKPQKVTSCFTKDSAPTNYNYNYYCYTQSNMCSKNKVNSTINSYVTSVDKKMSRYAGPTSSNLTNNQSGECILNNDAYYVGTVNGTKIYCSDSLETSLSGMISNLQVKSGTFMPVSSPTITVNHNCYFTLANHSAKEPYTTNIKNIYSKFASPSIKLNFMNKDYTFNGSSSSVDTGTLSEQSKKTVYGNDYYTYSFKTTYTPGYSSTLLNKYVDKKTATGSGDSFAPINGRAFNQMSENINISIPTDAKGTYSAKYTLGSNSYSNPAINKILSNSTTTLKTSYDTKKTVECGGTCKIEYSSKFLNCESTGSLIKEIFQNGYGNDLRISNTKDSCKFTMQFPVGSKAECTRAKGTLKTLTATYTKDSCTQKVVFNTSVTGADSSCSNSVTVENIDIKEDLVFRPISLSNPFPGQNGKGRSMGSPWTDDLKKTYITNRSNVYSKKPLYSITLTPSSIKQIRDYNKKNSYDDFNLTCSNGEACYSAFLRSAEYSKIVNTNKSNCYNANDRSVNAFNSCADYSKRQ